MLVHVRKLKFALLVGVSAAILTASLLAPVIVHADSPTSGVDSKSASLFNKLCADLKKIKGQNLYKANCSASSKKKPSDAYTTTTALTKAAQKICAKYGSKQLKDDCANYTKQQE